MDFALYYSALIVTTDDSDRVRDLIRWRRQNLKGWTTAKKTTFPLSMVLYNNSSLKRLLLFYCLLYSIDLFVLFFFYGSD